MAQSLAPCVAIVGPPNSGKTSFLHLLDQVLQQHPAAPLAHVVKGSPDGTGRYLLYASELREPLKERVKGVWAAETVETVAGWIDESRRHLDLVLLDFGGRHSPANDLMLRRCSHFIVVARAFPDPAEESANGLESWVAACRRNDLAPVALVRSVLAPGVPRVAVRTDRGLEAAFRGDAPAGEAADNRAVVAAIAEVLAELLAGSRARRYVDLRLGRRWTVEDLHDLGPIGRAITERTRRREPIVLGGYAPIWAYAAAMHRALEIDPAARIIVFDPKVAGGLVEVPARLASADSGLAAALSVAWLRASGRSDGATLDLRVTTPDRFLRPAHLAALSRAPRPAGEPSPGPRVVSGAAPIWLHLTYSRWLRSLGVVHPIGHWDAGLSGAVIVAGPGGPAFFPWELAPVPEGARDG
jgi:CRISPR-associated protein (Cas_csx3)